MTAAGFDWDAWGESIAAGFSSPASALQGLIVDNGVPDLGHRIQLLAMSSLFQDQNQVGIGIVSGSGTYGTYYTIDTAHADGDSNSFVTGVVFNDANGNGQYAVGEGLGGVTVTASNGESTTTTFGSGGYSLELAPGSYNVTFSGGGLSSAVTRSVTIGRENVEVDVTNPPPWRRRSTPVATPVVSRPVASPPSLQSIANQTITNASGTMQLALSASDPSGQALTYQVSVQGNSPAAALEQQYGFHEDSSGYHLNNLGQNEKLVVGKGSALWGWYEILPDGEVRPWLGGNSFGAAVATLGSAVWADPTLLTNAASSASTAGISGSVSGNTLTLTGLQGYTGTLQVSVTASDGAGSATQSFQVNVSNAALALASIGNVATTIGSPVQVALNATDASGRAVSYQVQVTGDNPAYDLEQSLGLDYTGNLLQNAIGLNEKWLQSSTSNQTYGGWYAILPDGEVRPWTGGNSTGATVARLDPAVYLNPSLLYNAAAPTAGASVNGSVLTLSPPGNFTGSLQVTVVASDGTSTTSRQFAVTVT